MKEIFQSYLRYYETLTPASVADLRTLAVPQLHFVDPFNDIRGVDEVIEVFERMFRRLSYAKFEVLEALEQEDRLFIRWNFKLRSALLKWGRQHTITGVSVVTLAADGKIAEHLDYWDSASNLYLHIPLIGWGIATLRRFFA